ncbi:MAG: Rid family detoxifying hydrolase [Burkholderiaceae bacterium]|jgi:2-iminobutanoate/2-iminopropanoate deaminase
MAKHIISTPDAPAAIGPYNQAIRTGSLVFASGQIGLDPATGDIVAGGFEAEVEQAFKNLAAVAKAAGGNLSNAVKLTLFLVDLGQFSIANEIMKKWVPQPYPARSTIGVASLPKGATFEVEAILAL